MIIFGPFLNYQPAQQHIFSGCGIWMWSKRKRDSGFGKWDSGKGNVNQNAGSNKFWRRDPGKWGRISKLVNVVIFACRCNEEEQYLIAISDTSTNSTSTTEVQELDRDLYLGIYAVFVICLLFFTLLRTQLFFKLTIVASRKLHLRMFSALLRAPSFFFDTNSIGESSFRNWWIQCMLWLAYSRGRIFP